MNTIEIRIAKNQYHIRRLGTERFKNPLHVALVWIKSEHARGYTDDELEKREGGGDSCKWYGVSYGSCGGPGRGKLEATLYGHKAEVFRIVDLCRMVGKKTNTLF